MKGTWNLDLVWQLAIVLMLGLVIFALWNAGPQVGDHEDWRGNDMCLTRIDSNGPYDVGCARYSAAVQTATAVPQWWPWKPPVPTYQREIATPAP
jgi:hypothetical protein